MPLQASGLQPGHDWRAPSRMEVHLPDQGAAALRANQTLEPLLTGQALRAASPKRVQASAQLKPQRGDPTKRRAKPWLRPSTWPEPHRGDTAPRPNLGRCWWDLSMGLTATIPDGMAELSRVVEDPRDSRRHQIDPGRGRRRRRLHGHPAHCVPPTLTNRRAKPEQSALSRNLGIC